MAVCERVRLDDSRVRAIGVGDASCLWRCRVGTESRPALSWGVHTKHSCVPVAETCARARQSGAPSPKREIAVNMVHQCFARYLQPW